MSGQATLDERCINTIRFLAADAIEKAKSGHPGMPMGAAAAAYTLWTRHLKHNPADPLWPDRDRFVLSAGHASMLLYALLYLTGYDLSLDDLRSFRQWGSKTPGHPERRHPPGAEMTTGPLGQGFAAAVGMAIAEAHLAARFNRPGHRIVDHFTYVFASDGDLMEGLSYEASALAGHLGLGKLIVLYDDNGIVLAGSTALCFTEDMDKRFAAVGWQVISVADGNDVTAVDRGLKSAKAETTQPSLIRVRTTIGCGAPGKQNSSGGPRLSPRAGGGPGGQGEPRLARWIPLSSSRRRSSPFSGGRGRSRRPRRRHGRRLCSVMTPPIPEAAAEFERVMKGELPDRLGEGITRLRSRNEGCGDAQDLGGRSAGSRPGDPGADGRFGRSESLHLHLAQGPGRFPETGRTARLP